MAEGGSAGKLVEMEKGVERDSPGIDMLLDPVLFLVFIDDLEEGLRSEGLRFADDTKIFRGVDSEVDRDVLQIWTDFN